jgi:hypothetical protein
MRLDLRSDIGYDFFLRQTQFAGIELKTIRDRLGACRQMKAEMGLYAGGNIGAGFYVDFDEDSETFERFLEYKPHADIVREIFRLILLIDGGSVAAKRECDRRGLFFPLFEPHLAATMNSRTGLRFCKPVRDNQGRMIGYRISRSLIRSILTNPAYIGKPARSGKLLEAIEFPIIVDTDLFWAVQKKLERMTPKRRGKIQQSEPHPFQGILFSRCRNTGTVRPTYYSSEASQRKHNAFYKCSCSDDVLEAGGCFYVTSDIIITPVTEFVLQQIAFPEMTDQVKAALQNDFSQTQTKVQAYRRERQRIEAEIETIRHNFSVMRLDSDAARMMAEDVERRLAELRLLEAKEKEVYAGQTLSQDDLDFVTGFLANLQREWHNVSNALQARLFNLILKQIVISFDGDDFLAEIQWQTGETDTLWIERPVKNVPRKRWEKPEIELLRQHYPNASITQLMEIFPGKSIDNIRSQANRQKLYRQVPLTEPWTEQEDDILRDFAGEKMSYKQMRILLRHRRQNEIPYRLQRLNLPRPDSKKIYWEVVNTPRNEPSSAIRSSTTSHTMR